MLANRSAPSSAPLPRVFRNISSGRRRSPRELSGHRHQPMVNRHRPLLVRRHFLQLLAGSLSTASQIVVGAWKVSYSIHGYSYEITRVAQAAERPSDQATSTINVCYSCSSAWAPATTVRAAFCRWSWYVDDVFSSYDTATTYIFSLHIKFLSTILIKKCRDFSRKMGDWISLESLSISGA